MPPTRNYAVNEAWIVFRVNGAPVRTEQDGDFNVVCLMDAASRYIICMEFVAVGAPEVSKPVAESLIEKGRAAANRVPRILLLSSALATAQLAAVGERNGIVVERVADKELETFVSEARQFFREGFGR